MLQAYSRHYPMQVRIARFENCYGPEGTWRGGREKAPAAMSRKVAEAPEGGTIDVWGDGTATRNFTYVTDMVDAIHRLTQSDLQGAVNLGGDTYVTVAELAQTVIDVSGKDLTIRYVPGPVGVQARNFAKDRSRTLGWEATTTLRQGIEQTYAWVAAQGRAVALGEPGSRGARVQRSEGLGSRRAGEQRSGGAEEKKRKDDPQSRGA